MISQTQILQMESDISEAKKTSKSHRPTEKSYHSNYLRNKKE